MSLEYKFAVLYFNPTEENPTRWSVAEFSCETKARQFCAEVDGRFFAKALQ